MTINLTQLIADREAGTPGDWRILPGLNDEYRICYNDDGNWLADVYYDEDDPDPEVDARRIARVPELEAAFLEAVELIHDLIAHEGAEGFSANTHAKIDQFMERFK